MSLAGERPHQGSMALELRPLCFPGGLGLGKLLLKLSQATAFIRSSQHSSFSVTFMSARS